MPRINPGEGGPTGQRPPGAQQQAIANQRAAIQAARLTVRVIAPDGTILTEGPLHFVGSAVQAVGYDAGEKRVNLTLAPLAREDLAAFWMRQAVQTSIGVVFVDVYAALNGGGLELDADFTDKGQVKAVVNWNKAGLGTQTVRLVQADDEANILLSLDVVSGRNVFALAALPAWASGQKRLKVQAKSTIGTDSPVFESCAVYLR